MKRLLLLFTALPLLVTACFNHTASLSVNGVHEFVNAVNGLNTGTPQATRPQATMLSAPALPQAPVNEATTATTLTVSLTGDVRLTREFDISSPYAGGSYEIDNLPVGAEVDVDVSLWQGDTKEYGTEFPASVRLETGTNEVTVELAQALQSKLIKPTVDRQDLPEGQPIDIGAEVGFEYGNNETDKVIHLSVSPAGGTIAGNDTSSPTLTFSARGSYTIEVYATAAGYAPSALQTYTINVDMLTLAGKVTADKTSITKGDVVSFQYDGARDAVIHLSGLPIGGFEVSGGGTDNGDGTVTGAPEASVDVTFKNKGQYTVAAWATAAGYAPSEPAEYMINVEEQLEGTITATAGGTPLSSGATIPTETQVTFGYNGQDVTPTITVSGTGVTDNGNGRVTFNTTGNIAVTVTATAADGYTPLSRDFEFTVVAQRNFAIGGITDANGGALPTTNYLSGVTTYLVGTDVTSLSVTLQAGATTYTGDGIVWGVSANGRTLTGNPASNTGTCTFTLDSLTTGIYTLTVRATVYETNALEKDFSILKFSNSGNFTLTNTVTITSGSLTIAPTSGTLTINAPANGAAFIIASGGELTLGGSVTIDGGGTGDLTIDGGGTSRSDALVTVNGGTLNLKDNAKIQNNTRTDGNGGGVYVGNSGTFTMNGGEISGNIARDPVVRIGYDGNGGNGGGVCVDGGKFTMNGTATISKNIASGGVDGGDGGSGGGVYVGNSGTFTMNGGEISGNKAKTGVGCGIHVASGMFDFNYDPDTAESAISGNTTVISGQGPDVYVAVGVNYTNPYRDKRTVDVEITAMEGLMIRTAIPGN